MVTLGAGIADVDTADLLHFVQNCAAAEDGQAQRLPVPAFATSDHIVNRGEGQFLMVQVPVYHSCARLIVSPSAFQVIRIRFLQRPPVLSAAWVRESWFWVSPSMGRGYPEAARVSTAKSRPSRGQVAADFGYGQCLTGAHWARTIGLGRARRSASGPDAAEHGQAQTVSEEPCGIKTGSYPC